MPNSLALEHALQIIQVAYRQVYLACHTRHQRKRTTTQSARTTAEGNRGGVAISLTERGLEAIRDTSVL